MYGLTRAAFALAASTLLSSCTTARPLEMTLPRYPMMLRSAVITGDMPVTLAIGADGRVRTLSLDTTTSGARGLFAMAVRRAMKDARFAPATRAGIPVTGTADFIFRFALTRRTDPLLADEIPGAADSLPPECPRATSPRIIVICSRGDASRGKRVSFDGPRAGLARQR